MTQAGSNNNTYNVHAAGVNSLELGEIPLIDSSIIPRLLIRNRAEHFEDQLFILSETSLKAPYKPRSSGIELDSCQPPTANW